MEVTGPDIAKYGVVIPNGQGAGISGMLKPDASEAPSNLALLGDTFWHPIYLKHYVLLCLARNPMDAIVHAQRNLEIVQPNGQRFDCGSADGFMNASNHEYKKRLGV